LLNETADVWCLTVPDVGHFSLANGAVVHNSHFADGFRYLALVAKGSKGQSAESHMRFRKGFGRMGDEIRPKVMLQYKDGRIMTTQTLDELAPLGNRALRIGRARRI
jgi:hypothetical protein